MRDKFDEKLFENPKVQEMLDSEQSYNNVLTTLALALAMDVMVNNEPVLLKFKGQVSILKGISDALLDNAQKTANPTLDLAESMVLNEQRTQLLNAFFEIYKDYASTFDTFLETRRQYAATPKENPFYKIDAYLIEHGKRLGLDAHLIQPIQRGPRYSMLVADAIKEAEKARISRATNYFQKLEELQTIIANQLSNINAARAASDQTEEYWFGKITYNLLYGRSEKVPTQPAPAPAEVETEKPAYKLGDYTRRFFRRFSKTDIGPQAASSSQAASSAPIPDLEEQDDGFTLLDTDGDNAENNTP